MLRGGSCLENLFSLFLLYFDELELDEGIPLFLQHLQPQFGQVLADGHRHWLNCHLLELQYFLPGLLRELEGVLFYSVQLPAQVYQSLFAFLLVCRLTRGKYKISVLYLLDTFLKGLVAYYYHFLESLLAALLGLDFMIISPHFTLQVGNSF